MTMAFQTKELAKAYWRENLKLLLSLLFVWALVSFGFGIVFVDALNQIHFFGFKLGFWFAQQGAIYTFVVLIFLYVYKMNRLDEKYDVQED
jgi:putative solute:sodium symporter small subunit